MQISIRWETLTRNAHCDHQGEWCEQPRHTGRGRQPLLQHGHQVLRVRCGMGLILCGSCGREFLEAIRQLEYTG